MIEEGVESGLALEGVVTEETARDKNGFVICDSRSEISRINCIIQGWEAIGDEISSSIAANFD